MEQGFEAQRLINSVSSWSTADVVNKDLYKNKVNQIPDTFSSVHHYMNSYTTPLIEETHADILSNIRNSRSAPFLQISKCTTDFMNSNDFTYLLTVYNGQSACLEYKPQVMDLIALTDERPKHVDLNKISYTFALVVGVFYGSTELRILSSAPVSFRLYNRANTLFAVHLTNLTTNMRIWKTLHLGTQGNTKLIDYLLNVDPSVAEDCSLCSEKTESLTLLKSRELIASLGHDDSQKDAILNCVALTECDHGNSVKLIWGPPGTGKTKTIASLLICLLESKRRTLICAPTNVAVVGVAKRLICCLSGKLEAEVRGSGDVVLCGNKERMKINEHKDLCDVFLDHRVNELVVCFGDWKTTLDEMICLVQDPKAQYQCHLKQRKQTEPSFQDIKKLLVGVFRFITRSESTCDVDKGSENMVLTFEEFYAEKFSVIGKKLIRCIKGLHTYLPTSSFSLNVRVSMIRAIEMLETSVRNALILKGVKGGGNLGHGLNCIGLLKGLRKTVVVPETNGREIIRYFCLKNACLVFSTVSGSAEFHEHMEPFELVIIDEAAQVKECESSIPLQLPGVRHAVLVGDEKQLPAMVISKICEVAGFGWSLFERLAMLGHGKQLLNVQYRMHPSISLFPNKEFYGNQIMDGRNVIGSGYDRRFHKDKMLGSYSFINVGFVFVHKCNQWSRGI